MLRIAICDDNTYLCHELEEMILKADTVHEGRVSTKLFYNGESLCSFVKQGNYFDIIFLDIEMDKMDGIIAGKEIRNVLRDEDVQIIYISAHQNYAMQLFSIRPMDFLIKPVTEDKIRERLQKAKELLGRKNALYEYQMNGQSCFIALKRIQYLEVQNRKITIHAKNGEVITHYGKLEDAKEKLQGGRFVQISRSELVNCDEVESYQKSELLLSDGERLPIRRSRQQEVQNIMLQYISETS